MSIDYRGERFSDYNVAKRTPSHPTKSHAVLAKVGDTVKLIRFGQQGVKGSPRRPGESERERKRREAFKARHAQSIAKGKLSAAWWADRVKWGTNPTETTMHRRMRGGTVGSIRTNGREVHIDIDSHNRSPGYRENAGAKMRAHFRNWITALSFFERYRRGSEAKLGHNTIVRTRSTGVAGSPDVEVVLHNTPIVTYHADHSITLNSGGWRSATTKARMNEILPANIGIVQKKGEWYVVENGGRGMGPQLKFFDGMRIGIDD